jgi:hypothetical protein
MSKRLSPRVARFFLDHPEEVAINTLVRLAERARVPRHHYKGSPRDWALPGSPGTGRIPRTFAGPRLPHS